MDRLWPYLLGGFLNMLFWPLVLGLCLWLTRRYFPRAERVLFGGVGEGFIALLRTARVRRPFRQARPRG